MATGKKHVVIFPSAGMGHLRPTVELARRLCGHGVSVTLLVSPWIYLDNKAIALVKTLQHHPSGTIRVHDLPDNVTITDQENTPPMKIEKYVDVLVEKSKPNTEEALSCLLSSAPISAFIVNIFTTNMLEVAAKFGIPSYIFFVCSASMACLMVSLPTIVSETTISFDEHPDYLVTVDGIGFPIPARDMPSPIMKRGSPSFEVFSGHASRFSQADGLLVTSFNDMEKTAIASIGDRRTPKVYALGPVLVTEDDGDKGKGKDIMGWLDKQPPSSVVLVSFGSAGSMPIEQIEALAEGLERSGERFLWVLRAPSHGGPPTKLGSGGSPDVVVSEVLPQGFLTRTSERGLVVTGWCPQVSILSHKSTGGFISHCGWNSISESIWYGVPLATWPLFAEQRLNRLLVLKQLGVGVDVRMEEDGFVKRESVEKGVMELMKGEKGKKARERMHQLMDGARCSFGHGGSSSSAWEHLLSLWSA